MRSFFIPSTRLDLFLIALQMNFKLKEPEYIFQMDRGFEIVFTREIKPYTQQELDKFVKDLWNGL